jgi:hypothetical protein
MLEPGRQGYATRRAATRISEPEIEVLRESCDAELVMKEHVFEARDLLVSDMRADMRARPLALEGR